MERKRKTLEKQRRETQAKTKKEKRKKVSVPVDSSNVELRASDIDELVVFRFEDLSDGDILGLLRVE